MRTLLLASLALAATTSPAPAGACGFDPQVFLFDHSFVRLGEPVPAERIAWKQVVPMSYDNTATAAAPALEHPRTFTLLGEGGTEVVSTAKRVWFLPAFRDQATAALAVSERLGSGKFRVALAGSYKNAKWITIAPTDAQTPERTAFAKELGVHPGWITMSTLGTDITILDGRGKDAAENEVRVLIRGAYPLKATGHAIGAIEVYGMRFLLIDNAGVVTTLMV